MTSSPIVAIGVWLMVLMVIVRIVRAIALGPIHRDPMRRFRHAEWALIFARAGSRCERRGWISRRCAERRICTPTTSIPGG